MKYVNGNSLHTRKKEKYSEFKVFYRSLFKESSKGEKLEPSWEITK